MRNFLFLVILIFAFGCKDDDGKIVHRSLDARFIDIDVPLEDRGTSDSEALDSELISTDAELSELDLGELDAQLSSVDDMSLSVDISELSDAQLDMSIDNLVDM